MNALALIAFLLLIVWVILRVSLAITSGLLHLLWIAAVLMFVFWLIGKARGQA